MNTQKKSLLRKYRHELMFFVGLMSFHVVCSVCSVYGRASREKSRPDWHVFVGIIYLGLKLKSFKFNEWRMDGADERERELFFVHKKKWAHVQLEFIIIDRPISCKVEKKAAMLCQLWWDCRAAAAHFSNLFSRPCLPLIFLPFSLLRDFQYSMLACCVCFFCERRVRCVLLCFMRKNEFQSAPEFVQFRQPDKHILKTLAWYEFRTISEYRWSFPFYKRWWKTNIYGLSRIHMMMGREERSLRLFHLFQKIAMFGLLCRHLYTIKRR